MFIIFFSDLHCCDKSSNADCRLACRNILRTQTIGQEIVDNLIEGGCGLPMPHVSTTLYLNLTILFFNIIAVLLCPSKRIHYRRYT